VADLKIEQICAPVESFRVAHFSLPPDESRFPLNLSVNAQTTPREVDCQGGC